MAGMYGCFKGRNSDSAAMASGTPDVMTSQEPAEVQEECSGKKKSKFQTFKKFFARKKRKDPSAAGADAGLKASQSSDNVSKASETLTRAEKDKGSGSKISLGGKALSHDSVFVSDSSEANEALGASQDSIHGKVKSLQLQLKQAIKLGSPPSLMCVKRTEDAGTMSEDDGLPCSPPEYTTLHTVLNQVQGNSSISLEGIDSDEDQLSCAASSRAVSPLVVPGDFSQPASPFVCLSNSAAKHKLALRQKAKRRPASRPEGKAGSDSVVEELLATSIPEAETAQQQDLQKAEDATDDLLKPKVESEEEEEEEVEEESEEEEQPQHSKQSPLGEKEEREEGEDESEAEQDVSQGPDTSCPPEPSHSEEEDSDTQPLPSSKLSSSTSSLDSPRVTPEPPAGLTDISIASGAEENKDVSHSASEGEEGGVQDHREEENSFLQEVLSSLKGPLMSSSLDMKTEGVILEMKEDEAEEKEKEEAEMEEGEEMEEEEDESLSSQATPSCSMLSDQTTKEREQVVTSFWQEEGGGEVAAKEEIKGGGEEETEDDVEEDEEDPVVERFIQSDDEEEADEQAVEVKTEEESNVLSSQTISQAGDSVEEEDEESDGEEEAIELEKKPDVEEVGWEKREEDEEVEVEVEATERTGVEEAEEAMEGKDDGAEEMPEMLPDTQDEEVQAPVQEADEGVVLEDDSVHTVKHTNDDQIPTEMADQVLTTEQEHFNQNSGDETEEGEEIIEEGVNLNIVEQKSDQEEGVEASQSDADQSEQELEQESVEVTPHSDTKQVERDPSEATEQDDVSSKPPPLSLPPHEPQSQEGEASTPSKTSTTTIHINLVSPSSEKATSLFQLPPAAADPSQSATEAPSYDIESTSIDKEEADAVGEEKQSIQDKEAPVSVEEKVNQPPCSTDQSKVRFTIAPAWQRSQSLNPPPSPPASVSSSTAVAPPCGEELETATEDSVMKAEPVTSPKVELVLSPSRVRNAGSSTAKPQSGVTPAPVTPKISTSASTEESSVTAEGNPDNPFGVRLRKTSALLRFSSEEENTEPPVESQTQPTSSKDDSPQPVSVKPSICPPVSNKPALPKKPEVHGDSGGKLKHVSDPAAGRGVSAGSVPPSWISVAKQKQKIYKENSLEEITVKKEEQERKSSLPAYVSSAASKEQGTKTAESKVSHLEMTKPSVSPDKEAKRPFSPPTPVPPQPLKSHPLPCPISPKPYVPPPQAKYPPQPQPLQRSLSTPDTPKSPVTPPSPSKTPLPVACSPFSRTTSEKPSLRAPGVSGQTASSQRNLPPPALAQDEPPWMALAKKKAKAWSEMPQIVQ